MSNETIHIHLEVVVPEANRAGFTQLMADLVENTSKEAGTLVYEWYEVGDTGTWHILERYADAENGDLHVKGFAETMLVASLNWSTAVPGGVEWQVNDKLGLKAEYSADAYTAESVDRAVFLHLHVEAEFRTIKVIGTQTNPIRCLIFRPEIKPRFTLKHRTINAFSGIGIGRVFSLEAQLVVDLPFHAPKGCNIAAEPLVIRQLAAIFSGPKGRPV